MSDPRQRDASRPPSSTNGPDSPSTDGDVLEVRATLGRTIRDLRSERSLTARALATRVGVTSGFISQLEHGQTMPSLPTLLKIASVLNVRIGDLFAAAPPSGQIVRRSERPDFRYPDLGMRDELLSRDPNDQLEVIIGYIDPGGGSGNELYTHGAQTEFIFVLTGSIDIVLGSDHHTLAEGDSITFPGDIPHRFRNPGPASAELLWVYTPAAY